MQGHQPHAQDSNNKLLSHQVLIPKTSLSVDPHTLGPSWVICKWAVERTYVNGPSMGRRGHGGAREGRAREQLSAGARLTHVHLDVCVPCSWIGICLTGGQSHR